MFVVCESFHVLLCHLYTITERIYTKRDSGVEPDHYYGDSASIVVDGVRARATPSNEPHWGTPP